MNVRVDPNPGQQLPAAGIARPSQRAASGAADAGRAAAPGAGQAPNGALTIEHIHLDIRVALRVETTNYGPQGQRIGPGMTREEGLRAIREWIRSLFEQQGLLSGGIEEMTPAEAAAAIGEGGYFGAEATASRILDFARSISGGDPKLAATIRDAFEEGFRQAEAAFGGKLPDISYQTRDLVRQGLDELFGPKPTEAGDAGQPGGPGVLPE